MGGGKESVVNYAFVLNSTLFNNITVTIRKLVAC